jgi:hypothetical protein
MPAHDYRSLVDRLMGKRSAMIDIGQTQLFSHPGPDSRARWRFLYIGLLARALRHAASASAAGRVV